MRGLIPLMAAGATLAAAWPVAADVITTPDGYKLSIPDATTTTAANAVGTSMPGGVYATITDFMGDTATAQISSSAPFARATGSAVKTGHYLPFSNAYALYNYYFVVLGPAPADVKVDISARIFNSGHDTAPGQFTSTGEFLARPAYSAHGVGVSIRCDDVYFKSGCGEHNLTFTITTSAIDLNKLTPGVVFDTDANKITLFAAVDPNAGASAFAFVDPLITIDPSTPNASDYRIYLNNGVGNAIGGGVPEPGAWALMLAGLIGLGVVLRSRRTAGYA
jgi:hypothetical protein